MAIEHDFFGVVEASSDGSAYWSENVELGDRSVDVSLLADDAEELREDDLDLVQAMIVTLEGIDRQTRESMVVELGDRSSVTVTYVDALVEELGESIHDILAVSSGDLPIDILRSLLVTRIEFRPLSRGDDDVFAVFEYTLGEDLSDDYLVASLNRSGEMVDTEIQGDANG
jgi:hypothetical protein